MDFIEWEKELLLAAANFCEHVESATSSADSRKHDRAVATVVHRKVCKLNDLCFFRASC